MALPRGHSANNSCCGVSFRDTTCHYYSMEKFSMKCLVCNGSMMSKMENVKYDEVGLPGVTLVGVEVCRCQQCGEYEVVIPRLADLHRALASAIIEKPGRLSGMEFRFLRKFLGFSSSDFARIIGVSESSISRWENEKKPIGAQTDRLLRLMVILGERVPDYSHDSLSTVAQDDVPQSRYEVLPSVDGWKPRIMVAG